MTGVRRVFTGVIAWVAGAVASVAVSLLALSVIRGGDVQPPAPVSALATGLPGPAGPGETDSPSPTGAASPSPSAATGAHPAGTAPTSATARPTPGPPRQFSTAGGVVTAQCIGQLAYLISWSPATGYRVDDVRRGPATLAEVAFVSTTQQLGVGVSCTSGVPGQVRVDS